jgi:hypothetical protein
VRTGWRPTSLFAQQADPADLNLDDVTEAQAPR